MKYIAIKDPSYFCNLNLYIDCTYDEFQKHLRRHLKDPDIKLDNTWQSAQFILLEKNSNKYYCIWLPKFNWYINEQALLVHEVMHYVFEALRQAGVKYCSESEEAYTYYFQRTYSDILKALEYKHYKNKRNKTKL